MKVLILFAHPAFHKSNVNRHLIDGLSEMEGITFHDLYEQYPEFDIDVKREQKLLKEHDCIIFHHPFFWYSTPAILKEWQDLVLEHGWAYGSKGNALKDKLFFNVITTGGPFQSYRKKDFHNHTMIELLAPVRQTAVLCKMNCLPPFVIHGTHALEMGEILEYKKEYFHLLQLLTEDKLEIQQVIGLNYLNDYLKDKEV